MNVAITGVSGYIGSRLLRRLDTEGEIKRIIGVDIKPPQYRTPRLTFYSQDISAPLGDIFISHKVDAAVHLAFVLKPNRDRARVEQTDVNGILNFLEACRQARVEHILYLSSHTVYGAHPDNPPFIKETWPLRPLPDFQYSWDKARTENVLQDFARLQNYVCTTVLRSCPVIGPSAGDSVVSLMFRPPVMVGVAGFDPLMQFVHEDDIAELVALLLPRKAPGIFNVAGDGEIKYSQIASIAHKKLIFFPERALRPLMQLAWTLHLQSESPPSGLDFIKYPPLVDTEKLKRETGFRFRYSSQEALTSFLSKEALSPI